MNGLRWLDGKECTCQCRVSSPGWEDPLEEEMATDSSILAWKIPRAERPGRLQSMGLQRVRHDLVTKQQLWKWYKRKTDTRLPSLGIRKGFLEEGWVSWRSEGWEGADQAEQEFLVLPSSRASLQSTRACSPLCLQRIPSRISPGPLLSKQTVF